MAARQERGEQGAARSRRHGEQQPSRGLRIEQHLALEPVEPGAVGEDGGHVLLVGRRAAGRHPRLEQPVDLRVDGEAGEGEAEGGPRGPGHAEGVAGEAEAGDVGRGVDAVLEGEAARHVVQPLHLAERRLEPGLVELVGLEGVDQDAGAERLGEQQPVAGTGAGVGEQALRVGLADHREAELELGVAHRMAAEERRAGLDQRLGGAAEDLRERRLSLPSSWEAAEVEGEERPAAHGVDVREGIGGGHPAEAAGVVADRGDEVGGGDQGAVAEAEDAGVVAGRRADEDPLIPSEQPDERGDHRRQVPRTDLGRSAAGGRAGGEAELAPEQCHGGDYGRD